jgi:hypothetical protein
MIEKNQALFQSIDKPFCLAYISDLKDEVLRKSLIKKEEKNHDLLLTIYKLEKEQNE